MSASDNFIFICSSCGYKARLPEQFAGRTIKCPGCQQPQTTSSQASNQRKSAIISRVANTPMPFSLPAEQNAMLTAPARPQSPVPKAFPSPLPGAVQVITDRLTRQPNLNVTGEAPPTAKPAAGATIEFACEACRARLRLPSQYAGKTILCPKCSAPQRVTPVLAPMDTTRTLAAAGEAAAVPSPTPAPRVRVTPIPQAYPPPQQAAEIDASLAVSLTPTASPIVAPPAEPLVAASPEAQPNPHDESLAEALASVTDEAPKATSGRVTKPHPSRGKMNPADMTMQRPVAVAAKEPAPVTNPSRMIAIIGAISVIAIVCAAGFAYHFFALEQSRKELAEAEAQAQAARASEEAARANEQAAAAKLAELEKRLVELEDKLRTAETKLVEPIATLPADQPTATEPAAVTTPTTGAPPEVTPPAAPSSTP